LGRVTAYRGALPKEKPVAPTPSVTAVRGIQIELIECGAGRPLLFLHPAIGIEADAPVLEWLAARSRVLAPTHPGFGRSDAPKSFDTVDDLAYFYLDLLDALDLRDVVLVGVSFGGWLAAEIAIKSTARVSHLVLGNPVGIKVGDREHRDIVDIFAISEDEFLGLAYHDASAGKRDYKSMPEVAVKAASRNREATARYAWSPYMHDPKLKGRLHRIGIPTLLLWGTSDRVLTEAYGRAYCAAIPGARFEPIERAGHFPHVEQPQAFADKVFAFTEGRMANSE
jgi:pimeloyl-ACP methyl ester carboxylesterase